MTEWVTHVEAARQLGVRPGTIQRFLARGELVRKPDSGKGSGPSIDPDSVEALRLVREQQAEQRAAAQLRRELDGTPPDDGHVWLDAGVVAVMVGLTRQWVCLRAREGRIPATFHRSRWWVRREDAEVLAAARAALAVRSGT